MLTIEIRNAIIYAKGCGLMQNVRDFGAKGDGKTLDTAAIQAAIDAGGEVFFPKGVYVTGTLYLKSNGGLTLDSGAVIKASHNRRDYNADDFCPQNRVFATENVTGAHLITAVGQTNIFIKGEGTIDGDANYWMNENNLLSDCDIYAPNPERPGQMIFICECSEVSITNVNILNSAYWHLFLHGCTFVKIKGLNIKGQTRQYTNDGIDIDCCENVTVSDCNIEVGDDGITLRAYDEPLMKPRPCENVVINNCIIRSANAFAIRIGVGGGYIRNCIFSNISVRNSNHAIGIVSRFSNKSLRGVKIENIIFNNITSTARRFFEIRTNNRDGFPPFEEDCYIKNISISNAYGDCEVSSYMYSYEKGKVSDIKFNNVNLVYGGVGPAPECNENGIWGSQSTDSAIELRDSDNILFNNCSIKYKADASGWVKDINAVNCKGIQISNCGFKKIK